MVSNRGRRRSRPETIEETPIKRPPAHGVWIVAVTAMVLGLSAFGFFDPFENMSMDFRFARRGPRPADSRVVLIDIDEQSIKALGLFPWPRETHARLIERLVQAGAAAIAFDVLFVDEDPQNAPGDAALGRAAEESGRTVFGEVFSDYRRDLPTRLEAPIEAVRGPSVQYGFVNAFPEDDGVLRRSALWLEFEGKKIPSLALAALAAARRESPDKMIRQLSGGVPGRTPLINFSGWNSGRGGSRSPYHYHSYADVLQGRLDPGVFNDKIVLVGGTAMGLFDSLTVPNLPVFPGLEIHANIVDNLLNHSFLWSPPRWGTWGIVFLFQMVLGTWLAGLTTSRGTTIVLGGVVGYYFLAQLVFNRWSLALDVVAPMATTLANHGTLLFRRLLAYEREIA